MEDEIKERLELEETYKLIIDKIVSEESQTELTDVYKRLKEVIEYNVPKGKRERGLLVVIAFKMFAKTINKSVTEDEMRSARILGWILEILQAFALMLDDVMDQSITRRVTSLYPKVGRTAILDSFLLEREVYQILKIFISDKPFYRKIIDEMHEIMRITSYGQLMDVLTCPSNERPDFQLFTKCRLESIYKYKTSFYTFILPFKFGMYLCSTDLQLNKLEPILLKMGHLFQMQDDMLDCFGDEAVAGKIGTDIEVGKCCWPIVTALQLCNDSQSQVLRDSYGIRAEDKVRAVKQIYRQINLIDVYRDSEALLFAQITDDIQALKSENISIVKTLTYILAKISKKKIFIKDDFHN